MQNYLNLLQEILDTGVTKADRTGVGTISIFGTHLRYDLSKGFPAVTTKELKFKSVLSELLWFISGSTNELDLREIHHGTRDTNKKTIWTANAEAEYWKPSRPGDLGHVYGYQWRKWNTGRLTWNSSSESEPLIIDQLDALIKGIKSNPDSRRHIVTAWNPGEIDIMALPPCHYLFQCYIANGKLSLKFNMRSVDCFLGLPFNIASYAILCHMIAQVCDLQVGDLIFDGGDTHIYLNHIDQVTEQLSRTPLSLSTIWLNPDIKEIDAFTMNDIKLLEYHHHPSITAKMAV